MDATHSDLRVQLPVDVYDEIHRVFPHSHKRRVDESHSRLRNAIVYQLHRATHDRHACFSMNRDLHGRIHGTRARKKLFAAIESLSFLQLLRNYRVGVRSKVRQIKHPKMGPTNNSPGGCGVGPEFRCRRRHGFRCAQKAFVIDLEWMKENGQKFRAASAHLWGNSHDYVEYLTDAVSSLHVAQPTIDDCAAAALVSDDCSWSVERRAHHYLREWDRFTKAPLAYCFRKAGRVYHPVCNQPKSLRRQFLKFDFGGDLVDAVEVDLSASYYAFLATMLPPASDVDLLRRDLSDGRFYEAINESCTSQNFTERTALKLACQIQCLFGTEGYGYQPLYGAMRSRYPTLEAHLRAIRFYKNNLRSSGARELSSLLTKAEGAFFIDLLLPQLSAADIPALTIHDGVIVPRPVAHQVREYAAELFRNTFGFDAVFSLKE